MPSALVTKLRKQPEVRDAEALAAWIGRYQKLRKAGISNKKAMKLAGKEGGMKEGGVKAEDRKMGGGKTTDGKPITITIEPLRGRQSWVAEVTSTDSKYGFKREFLDPESREYNKNGRLRYVDYKLKGGRFYEIAEGDGKRSYAHVQDGKAKYLQEHELRKRLSGASKPDVSKNEITSMDDFEVGDKLYISDRGYGKVLLKKRLSVLLALLDSNGNVRKNRDGSDMTVSVDLEFLKRKK